MTISGIKSGVLHKYAALSAVCVALLLLPQYANTQEIAETPCDAEYFDSLEARAWLEAQREITQNQNLIFKADSVLEYTCFDKFANVLAEQAINMFSETTRWGEVLPADSMDRALDGLVGSALISYTALNFGHNLLGERWGYITPGPPGDPDYLPQPISGGAYECDVMNRVWAQAKCMDFIEYEVEDGFFTFEHYIENEDKRFLPERCGAEGRWGEMLETALIEPPWQNDPVYLHLNRLANFHCGQLPDFPPIPTGITVIRPTKEPKEYEEKACMQTGCYYEPASGTCISN